MISKRAKKNIDTVLIVLVIISLAIPLIVFSSNGGSSSGGCCSSCSCNSCCSSEDLKDTQGDGSESAEDQAPPPVPTPVPNICQTTGYKTTKVNGTLQQTNLSNHYEYSYSYTIIACKETVNYKITLEGIKLTNPEGGATNTVPMNSSVSRSGTYSSQQVVGYENVDIFNRMVIEVSDKTAGSCGAGKFCYNEK